MRDWFWRWLASRLYPHIRALQKREAAKLLSVVKRYQPKGEA
jgi:hypothetical protein